MAQLEKIIIRKYTIKAETGLQINGPGTAMGPGGLDSEVVKNPLTGEPYIPGSSIKGRMRALLELKLNKSTDGKPCGCGERTCMVCTLFGKHINKNTNESGIPRALFRDAELKHSSSFNRGLFEDKASTMIDRKSGTAANGSLRHIERVAAGTEFDFEIAIQVFRGDNVDKLLEALDTGIALIEATGLGGGVSRGNGKVTFTLVGTKEIK